MSRVPFLPCPDQTWRYRVFSPIRTNSTPTMSRFTGKEGREVSLPSMTMTRTHLFITQMTLGCWKDTGARPKSSETRTKGTVPSWSKTSTKTIQTSTWESLQKGTSTVSTGTPSPLLFCVRNPGTPLKYLVKYIVFVINHILWWNDSLIKFF